MPLDHKVISRKLLQARQLQSLSIEEVSQAVGIEVGRIGQIESGQIRPSGDEVLILANFYRHDFRDFLDDSRPAPFEQTDILYRQHGDAFTPQDRRAIQEFIYLCEIEAALESEMSVAKKSFAFIPKGAHFKSQGESAAKALRAHLGYAANVVPRDVFDDFRQIGIHLFRRRLTNSDISGLYIEHPIAGHCALINYDEDIYRQRFSASHEAAHVIFDSSESVVVTYKHGTSRYGERDLKEIRANRFASCYLMPPDQLPRVPRWSNELSTTWAQQFRVSTAALSIALREAELVDEVTAKQIRSIKVSPIEKVDPEAPGNLTERQRYQRMTLLERGLSDYYVGLCFEAHHRGLISAGRLSEALLTDHSDMREISVLYGRALRDGA